MASMSARLNGTDFGTLPSMVGARASAVGPVLAVAQPVQPPDQEPADLVPDMSPEQLATGNSVRYVDGLLCLSFGSEGDLAGRGARQL